MSPAIAPSLMCMLAFSCIESGVASVQVCVVFCISLGVALMRFVHGCSRGRHFLCKERDKKATYSNALPCAGMH